MNDDFQDVKYSDDILKNEIEESEVKEARKLAVELLKDAEFDLDKALDTYDPTFPNYKPSLHAVEFFNYMRLVQGNDFEFSTPIAHYFMVDLLLNEIKDTSVFPYSKEINGTIELNHLRIAFMCSRGIAKSSLVISFFGVYSAIKGELPNGIGKVWFYLVLAASSRGGARVNALAVKAMCEDSVFLNNYFESMRFTESESEFVRKGTGPKKNRSFLIRYQGVGTGVRGIRYGERRICCHEKGTMVTTEYGTYPVEEHPGIKAESQFDDGVEVSLRGLTEVERVNMEHQYYAKICVGNKCVIDPTATSGRYKGKLSRYTETEPKMTRVTELTSRHWVGTYIDTEVVEVEPIPHLIRVDGPTYADRYETQMRVSDYMLKDEWWWMYGLWLGDGSLSTRSMELDANNRGIIVWYIANTQEHTVGKRLLDCAKTLNINTAVNKRNVANGCYSVSINKTVLADWLRTQKGSKNSEKNMSEWVLKIDKSKQKQILLGYIAADGYIEKKHNHVRINSVNLNILKQLQVIGSRLGLPSHIRNTKRAGTEIFPNGKQYNTQHQWEIKFKENLSKVLSIPDMVESTRVKWKQVHISNGFMWRQVKEVRELEEQIEVVPIQCNNSVLESVVGTKYAYNTLFGVSHNCIILDDIILNEAAAYSKTITDNLTSMIHSDAVAALKGGGKGRIINCFTPFHYSDVNTSTVINGSYTQCVVPIARNFNAEDSKQELDNIESTWEAMHPAKSIKDMVVSARKEKKVGNFLQERMLRLTSGSERLVPDDCFQWYNATDLLFNIHAYSVYITTDYTTTSGEKSDFSGKAVWALSNNEDWFLLDLSLKKMTMEEQYIGTLNSAAKLKRRGKHVEIGVEVDGNQASHVYALEQEMMKRSDWYSFARQKGKETSTRKGILSKATGVNKHERFRIASQHFLQKKIWLPEHLKETPDMIEFLAQIKGATHEAFTRSDDGPDLISQLDIIAKVYPTEAEEVDKSIPTGWMGNDGDIWWEPESSDNYGESTIF